MPGGWDTSANKTAKVLVLTGAGSQTWIQNTVVGKGDGCFGGVISQNREIRVPGQGIRVLNQVSN